MNSTVSFHLELLKILRAGDKSLSSGSLRLLPSLEASAPVRAPLPTLHLPPSPVIFAWDALMEQKLKISLSLAGFKNNSIEVRAGSTKTPASHGPCGCPHSLESPASLGVTSWLSPPVLRAFLKGASEMAHPLRYCQRWFLFQQTAL